MSLSAYLAKNYLNASTSSDLSTRPKKRRKKDKSTAEASGLIIEEDDVSLLSNTGTKLVQDSDEDGPALDAKSHTAEFRKSKKNNWKWVGVPAPLDSEQAEADRILTLAAEERRRKQAEEDGEDGADAPALVAGADSRPPKLESGVRAGLQTAAETEAMVQEAERRKNAELKASKRKQKEAPMEETVYRDATGRRIDVSMKRAEARAAEQEKLRQEHRDKEDAMGEVQKREKDQKKADLEDAKFLGVARYEDDEVMNEELKGVRRWNDPMAQYLANSREPDEDEDQGGKSSRRKTGADERGRVALGPAVTRKKVYQGAAPPNRYGILPGWRWDGVDRGNGFEKDWFQARGRKSRNENLEYQWQMDE